MDELLNYIENKLKTPEYSHLKMTDDVKLREGILSSLNVSSTEADTYFCPCMLKPTKCLCKTVPKPGSTKSCHCGLFVCK